MTESVYSSGYKTVMAAVVAMRKAAGLTQRELAEKLGVPQNFVGRVETNQRRLDFVELIRWIIACGGDPASEVAKLAKSIGARLPKGRGRRRREER